MSGRDQQDKEEQIRSMIWRETMEEKLSFYIGDTVEDIAKMTSKT